MNKEQRDKARQRQKELYGAPADVVQCDDPTPHARHVYKLSVSSHGSWDGFTDEVVCRGRGKQK